MRIPIILLSLLFAASASANQRNALPNCYAYAKLSESGVTPDTELFVIIDQTTPLDKDLRQAVADNIKLFLKPGNTFSVTQFSAFTQGHYASVLVAASLYSPLEEDERNDTGKAQLSKFDQCMKIQTPNAMKIAGAGLRKAFAGTTAAVSKSDVLASLKDISSRVRASTAKRKVVLLVSDMLENSSITSFYSKQTVRKINPEIELKLVEENNLYTDFSNARVYVLGAGLLTSDANKENGAYRDPKTMAALQKFWRLYFKKSNGQLIEFGQPALLNPLH